MTLDPSLLMKLSQNALLKDMHKQPTNSVEESSIKDKPLSPLSLTMGELKTETTDEKLLKARKRASVPPIFKRIIINPEWKIIQAFDLLIVIFALLSSLVSLWFANFGMSTSGFGQSFDIFMECCFGIDILKNFFMMY